MADIRNQPWSRLVAFDDIDDAMDTFYKLYLNIWYEHASLKTRFAPKQTQLRMKHRIHDTLRQRDVSYHKALESKSKTDRAMCKVQRNKYTSSIRKAKRKFLTESARYNSTKFWKQLK